MTVTDEFLDANAAYASSFAKGDLPMPPGRKLKPEEIAALEGVDLGQRDRNLVGAR